MKTLLSLIYQLLQIRKYKKPVIVTAANDVYYRNLQNALYHIHKYIPDYELFVYDIGLTEEMYNMVGANFLDLY